MQPLPTFQNLINILISAAVSLVFCPLEFIYFKNSFAVIFIRVLAGTWTCSAMCTWQSQCCISWLRVHTEGACWLVSRVGISFLPPHPCFCAIVFFFCFLSLFCPVWVMFLWVSIAFCVYVWLGYVCVRECMHTCLPGNVCIFSVWINCIVYTFYWGRDTFINN